MRRCAASRSYTTMCTQEAENSEAGGFSGGQKDTSLAAGLFHALLQRSNVPITYELGVLILGRRWI